MKSKIGKLYGLVLALVFCVGLSVFSLSASASGSYTLAVGDEMTLYSNIPSRYALKGDASWTSSNYHAVEITMHTDSYCKIRVNQYFSSPVIIRCDYYYVDPFDGASYMREGFTDFTIYISKSGSSSGSTGNMTVSPSSVSLDLASGKSKTVTLKYNKGSATRWSFGFLSENGCVESWTVGTVGLIGTEKVEVYAKKPGRDTVTCILYVDGKKIASAKLNVNVTCSHKYDKGVVSVKPTSGKKGTKVYTCQIKNCGHKYTTSIPALSNNKKNGSVKLNKKSAVLYPGQKLSLSLKNAKSGKQNWSSSNSKVATVNAKGKVTAKKPGTVNIRVKTGGKTYTCRVTVKKLFTVSSSKLSVEKGKKETVTVTCGKKLKLKYKIKNKRIVSCKWKKGKGKTYKLTIQGKKKGKTTITLTNSFNGEKIKLNVNVKCEFEYQ